MKDIFTTFATAIFAAILIGLIIAWPAMLLWNSCAVPAVNGLNPIGFWQALGIVVLANILFKSNVSSKNEK